VGFIKLKSSFHKIHHFGNKITDGGVQIPEDDALQRVRTTLAELKLDLETAQTWCKLFYEGSLGERCRGIPNVLE